MKRRQLRVTTEEDLKLALEGLMPLAHQHPSHLENVSHRLLAEYGEVYLHFNDIEYLSFGSSESDMLHILMETKTVKVLERFKDVRPIVPLWGKEYYEDEAREALEAVDNLKGKSI